MSIKNNKCFGYYCRYFVGRKAMFDSEFKTG